LNARLMRDCSVPPGDPFAVTPDERGDRAGHRERGEAAVLVFSSFRAGEADAAAVEVGLDAETSSASMGTLRSFPPLPLTWMTAAPSSVVGISPTSARRSFLGAQAGKQSGQNQRQIPFSPLGSAFGNRGRLRRFPGVRALPVRGRALGGLGKFRAADELHGVGGECSPV